MLNLVAHAKEELQRELLENLYRSASIDDLLKESEVYPILHVFANLLSSSPSIDGRNVNEWSNH